MSVANKAFDFVRYILESVCSDTDALSIELVEDDRGQLILVKASKDDMGKIIGKGGSTVSALRTLITNISARENTRVSLKVEEL